MSDFKTIQILFDVGWSDRKIAEERRDLCQLVMQAGGKNVRFEVVSATPEPLPDRWLKILCKPCDAIYYSKDQVIPCPRCNGRDIERLGRVSAPPVEPMLVESGQLPPIPAGAADEATTNPPQEDLHRADPETIAAPSETSEAPPEEAEDEGPLSIPPEVLGR